MAEPERLLRIQLPEPQEVEAFLVRLSDGRVVARTAEELEELREEGVASEGTELLTE